MAFGFLLLPPLTAYLFARSMRQMVVGASVLGAVCAFAGFCLAYRFDLPAGPAEVALLGVVHLLAVAVKRITGWAAGLRDIHRRRHRAVARLRRTPSGLGS